MGFYFENSRRLFFNKINLTVIFRFNVSILVLRYVFEKKDFHRRLARRKPLISLKNQVLRFIWIHMYFNWIRE